MVSVRQQLKKIFHMSKKFIQFFIKRMILFFLFLPVVLLFKSIYLCFHNETWTVYFLIYNYISFIPFIGPYLLSDFFGNIAANINIPIDIDINNLFGNLTFCGGLGGSIAYAFFELFQYQKMPMGIETEIFSLKMENVNPGGNDTNAGNNTNAGNIDSENNSGENIASNEQENNENEDGFSESDDGYESDSNRELYDEGATAMAEFPAKYIPEDQLRRYINDIPSLVADLDHMEREETEEYKAECEENGEPYSEDRDQSNIDARDRWVNRHRELREELNWRVDNNHSTGEKSRASSIDSFKSVNESDLDSESEEDKEVESSTTELQQAELSMASQPEESSNKRKMDEDSVSDSESQAKKHK